MENSIGKQSFYLQLPQSREYLESVYSENLPLHGFDYFIDILPKSNYWRFAIQFHKKEFVKSSSPEFKYTIFLGAGTENSATSATSKYDYRSLIFGHSGLSSLIGVPSVIPYQPKTPLRLSFSVKELHISLHVGFTEYGQDLSYLLPGDDFEYFTIYIWSDGEPVEVEGTLDRQRRSTTESTVSGGTTTTTQPQDSNPSNQNQPLKYYLLKIRDETWNTDSFQPGMQANFGTYQAPKEKRPDYDLFANLKQGDQLIGYECESNDEIVCVFSVTRAIHLDEKKEEIVSLEIKQCIRPPIPLDHFRQKINFVTKLPNAVWERLFPITPEQFDALLQPRPVRNPHSSILGSFTKEGNHLETKDQLNFTYDILSFATIIALKNVKPPLAIGLFGNWGSGKSFFMEQLEKEIDEKAKNPGSLFVQNVVQVKFNSWHYSDANLWASLISKIFEELFRFATEKKKLGELESITNDLKITQLQKDVTSTKKIALENRQLELQREQETMRKTLRNRTGIDTLKTLIRDPKLQQDLAALNNQNIETLFKEAGKVQEFINEVQSEKKRWSYFVRTYFSLRARWLWIIFLVFFIFCFSWAVRNMPVVTTFWNNITARFLTYVLMVGAFLAKIQKAYAPIKRQFDVVYTKLVSLKQTMDAQPVNESPRAAELRTEIESNQKELEVLKQQLQKLETQQNETQTELNAIRSGKKLMEFIEQKTTAEQYSKQLGLISLIRKDFEQLDKLLRQQKKANEAVEKKPKESTEKLIDQEMSTGSQNTSAELEGVREEEKLRIDRIVLYIDDLDRCNEEIVVHVLEAVHLLMAFELFVVVVGVDPRWLNKSLNKKYSFFSDNGNRKKIGIGNNVNNLEPGDAEDDDEVAISSFDYLEKIFQIPFALKPITKEGREALIGYLVQEEIEKEVQQTINNDPHLESPSQDPNTEASPATNDGDPISGISGSVSPDEKRIIEISGNSTTGSPASATITALKALKFTPDEAEFMKEVSVLFGHTPRTIKRFVNIYRIIKSHGNLEPGSDYRATLLVLAVIVGCPYHAQDFVRELGKSNHNTIQELLNEPALSDLRLWAEKQLNNRPVPKVWRSLSVASLQANMELISRFSFRTYSI